MRDIIKTSVRGLCLTLVFPFGLLTAFGRINAIYTVFAHLVALIPGLLGDYLRIAYYKLTLDACSLSSRLSFGSFFAHPHARIGKLVYIGSYCILGKTTIGDRTQIASATQILSGGRQHSRDALGRMTAEGEFASVRIGADCWIGAGAIVMADVGDGCTIGAGSVVTRPIPPQSVAVGSPAKVIKTMASGQNDTSH